MSEWINCLQSPKDYGHKSRIIKWLFNNRSGITRANIMAKLNPFLFFGCPLINIGVVVGCLFGMVDCIGNFSSNSSFDMSSRHHRFHVEKMPS